MNRQLKTSRSTTAGALGVSDRVLDLLEMDIHSDDAMVPGTNMALVKDVPWRSDTTGDTLHLIDDYTVLFSQNGLYV